MAVVGGGRGNSLSRSVRRQQLGGRAQPAAAAVEEGNVGPGPTPHHGAAYHQQLPHRGLGRCRCGRIQKAPADARCAESCWAGTAAAARAFARGPSRRAHGWRRRRGRRDREEEADGRHDCTGITLPGWVVPRARRWQCLLMAGCAVPLPPLPAQPQGGCSFKQLQ